MKITGLIEVILYVRDMPREVAFYRDTIGLEISYPVGMADYSSESWVTFACGACSLALHSGGLGRLGADTPMLVFGVDDIHSAWQELSARGVPLGEIFSAAPGIWVAHAVDPEGNPFAIEKQEGRG